MASLTLQHGDFVLAMRRDIRDYQIALQRAIELEMLEEMRRASRRNYRNRTGRLWRSQRRVPGSGVRIGSRYAPYWAYLDGFTRGSGQFIRTLFNNPFTRQQVVERAIARVEREGYRRAA